MRATAWISWFAQPKGTDGNSIIPPIDPNCPVEIMRRDGETRLGIASQFNWFNWPEFSERDVIAYRIVWKK